MRADRLRLGFALVAYVLMGVPRRIVLQHTPFAQATCGTSRRKLLRIGAPAPISVRRIKIAMASAGGYQSEFALAHSRLTAATR